MYKYTMILYILTQLLLSQLRWIGRSKGRTVLIEYGTRHYQT